MRKLKILIKELNEGKNLKENIPIYQERLARSSHNVAMLNFTMDYYSLCETMVEELNPHLMNEKDTVERIQTAVKSLFLDKERDESSIGKGLKAARNDLLWRQEALTAYIDKLMIYEYVLNRIELRFVRPDLLTKQKMEMEQCEQGFVRELMQFIFQNKETAVMNQNIKEVIGQLPVRMTKSKFFELLNQSLTIYKGVDKSSLERYLYMIRTNAMLYEPKEKWDDFQPYEDLLDELEKVDYKDITKETLASLQRKMEMVTKSLHDVSELYMQLSRVVNHLLAYTLTEGYGCRTNETCQSLVERVFAMMEQKRKDGDYNETFDELEISLYDLEGSMEKAYEENLMLDAVLYQLGEYHKPLLKELSLEDRHKDLVTVQKLLSNSLYAELKENAEEIVDAAYIEQCTIRLIREMEERFKQMQRPVIRAVMAAVLSNIPVFFGSAKEVEDYIAGSLRSCTDIAEKITSVSLLRSVMDWNYGSGI